MEEHDWKKYENYPPRLIKRAKEILHDPQKRIWNQIQ